MAVEKIERASSESRRPGIGLDSRQLEARKLFFFTPSS
jgi:hypothetical protein